MNNFFLGHQSGGSGGSSGPDPSSSDLSADTVIYMGPCGEQTDGEHPPVYLPSLSSGDQRCSMGKVLKGSGLEKLQKSPMKKIHSPKCKFINDTVHIVIFNYIFILFQIKNNRSKSNTSTQNRQFKT
jgi:hypothetical protein